MTIIKREPKIPVTPSAGRENQWRPASRQRPVERFPTKATEGHLDKDMSAMPSWPIWDGNHYLVNEYSTKLGKKLREQAGTC